MNNLTEEQKSIVKEYQLIFAKLSILEERMQELKAETTELVAELEQLREKDKNIFENYGKKEF
jgi:chromosome segregation ATPase